MRVKWTCYCGSPGGPVVMEASGEVIEETATKLVLIVEKGARLDLPKSMVIERSDL